MGMVYFKSNSGVLVTMDGDTSIDVSKTNTVTETSVISTKSSSDDVIEGLLQISVQGVVTYSKSPSQEGNPTPSEWIDLIEETIASKTRITLYNAKNSGGKPLLKDYSNLVIADYGYTVDRFEDTITTRINFKEVFVSNAATETTLTPKKSTSTKASLPTPSKGGDGTSTEVTEEKASLLYSAAQFSLF